MVAAATTSIDQTPSSSAPTVTSTPDVTPASSKPSKKKKKTKPVAASNDSDVKVERAPKASSSTDVARAEIEASPAPELIRSDSGAQGKGPLEELVSKRMRVLSKKIQKLKTYQQQPDDKLNPDQRSALSSLPMLEGAYKELDEVAKTVELVELEQASKAREQRAEDEKELHARVQAAVGDYEAALISPLVFFVTLQGLINPPNRRFDPLSLPEYLRDHVDQSDSSLFGELWQRLIAGGDSARHALQVIRRETDGNGHWTRVHELMDILVTPTKQAESPAPVQVEAPEQPSQPAEPSSLSSAFNFLQEDELQAEPAPEPERVVETQAPVEVVIPEEPVKVEADGPQAVQEAISIEPESAPTPVDSTAAPTAATSVAHWADDGDDDEVDLEMLRGAFGAATPARPASPEPTKAVKQAKKEEVESAVSSPTPDVATKRPAPKKTQKKSNGKPRSPTQATFGDAKSQQRGKSSPRQNANGPTQAKSTVNGHPEPAPVVDDDGFVPVHKKRPTPKETPSSGRGRGSGIRNGPGGRGGRPEGQGPKRDATQRAPSEAKPSIYKA